MLSDGTEGGSALSRSALELVSSDREDGFVVYEDLHDGLLLRVEAKADLIEARGSKDED